MTPEQRKKGCSKRWGEFSGRSRKQIGRHVVGSHLFSAPMADPMYRGTHTLNHQAKSIQPAAL